MRNAMRNAVWLRLSNVSIPLSKMKSQISLTHLLFTHCTNMIVIFAQRNLHSQQHHCATDLPHAEQGALGKTDWPFHGRCFDIGIEEVNATEHFLYTLCMYICYSYHVLELEVSRWWHHELGSQCSTFRILSKLLFHFSFSVFIRLDQNTLITLLFVKVCFVCFTRSVVPTAA